MANDRQLMVLDQLRDPFSADFTFEESERILQEIVAKNEQQLQSELSAFFFDHDGADFDMIADTLSATIEEALAEKPVIKTEIKIEMADDPLHEKEFANSQTLFEKIKEEDKKRANGGWFMFEQEEEAKKPIVEVLNGGGRNNGTATAKPTSNYAASANNNTTYQQTSAPSYQTAAGNGATNAQPQAGAQKNTKHVFNNFEHFAKSMQNAAYNYKGSSKQDDGWAKYAKKTWWQKTKAFFKSTNFRIGLKLAAMLSLQLGMAVIGKKYEINGLGEGAVFIGCMMGVFFLSRELSKEGIDARAFGF